MRTTFHHEQIYRPHLLEKLAQCHITVCGVGALGSNLADNLARHGARKLRLIDFDRVEQHNIGPQIYSSPHIGALKVAALQQHLFQATNVEAETHHEKLTEKNVKKLLKKTNLVIDAFDNTESRQTLKSFCHTTNSPCLHVGLHSDYGEVVWNEKYVVPQSTGDLDPCDYPLARNIVLLSVAVATEEIFKFIEGKKQTNYQVTLKDLNIRKSPCQFSN